MTPLYLQGQPGMSVALDVPALSVSMPDKTRQLFPLARVSRVVVSGTVDWSMSALLACADAGISVVFLADGGAVRACWLGTAQPGKSVVQQLAQLLQRAEGVQAYQDWYIAMQRMALRSSARRLGLVDWQTADAETLSAWLVVAFADDWLSVPVCIQGFLLSAIIKYLGDFGLDARCEFFIEGSVNLAEDLSRLLVWDFYPVLLSWSKRCQLAPEQVLIVKFYEARQERVEHLLRGLLNRLHQCLLEKT